MGKRLQALTISFLLLSLILNSVLPAAEARLLNGAGLRMSSNISGEIEGFVNGLSLGVKKHSEPSPGVGQRYDQELQTLGGVKKSGPSPGEGHSYVNGDHL